MPQKLITEKSLFQHTLALEFLMPWSVIGVRIRRFGRCSKRKKWGKKKEKEKEKDDEKERKKKRERE